MPYRSSTRSWCVYSASNLRYDSYDFGFVLRLSRHGNRHAEKESIYLILLVTRDVSLDGISKLASHADGTGVRVPPSRPDDCCVQDLRHFPPELPVREPRVVRSP